jgi:hypothetical protein
MVSKEKVSYWHPIVLQQLSHGTFKFWKQNVVKLHFDLFFIFKKFKQKEKSNNNF